MNNKMTVVFIGFDGYKDVWNDCINLYHKYWPDNSFKTIFVNNELDIGYENVEVLHAGKDAEWSKKVNLAIENIDTPYICLLLEDFLFGDNVDNKTVEDTLDFIEKENIRYYKLVNMNRAVKNRDPLYKDIKYLHIIPKSDEYGISLQAAIWKKDYLKELLGDDNYNAWKFEFDRVKEADYRNNDPNPACIFDDRNILNLKHGVIQSKYLPNTIKYFKKKGINLNVEREVMSYFQYYKLRFISKSKYLMPKSLRKKVKHILEKFGMKFVSTERDNNE